MRCPTASRLWISGPTTCAASRPRAPLPARHRRAAINVPTAAHRACRKAHVPPRLTSFVGREERRQGPQGPRRRQPPGDTRGPGGTGKTALAMECARALAANFGDGAGSCRSKAMSDAELVPAAIAGALGLRDTPRRPARDQLLENLAQRDLLLVLDNFEQVMSASELVGAILATAPSVRLMTTSRAPLHLTGEQVYPVAPLPLPDRTRQTDHSLAATKRRLSSLQKCPAIRLFIDRVRRVQPTFALTADNAAAVVDICTRLDGLPLGIELAAARVPLLGVAAIADRLLRHMRLPSTPLRDVPDRQRTLQEAIGWSHGLLDPRQRILFACLSIFNGGWRLDRGTGGLRTPAGSGRWQRFRRRSGGTG